MGNSTISKAKLRPWAIVLWLVIWQCAAMLVGRDFLLASPIDTLRCFFELALTAEFWQSALLSLGRILLGFLLGAILGTLLAALAARYVRFEEAMSPLMAVLRAIPVASFVVVALIWTPSRYLSVLIAFLIVFPLMYGGTLSEIRRADPQLIEMAQVFHMSRLRRMLYLYILPSLDGYSVTGKMAMGLAWKSGVAAELIAIPLGSIGERLYQAKVYLMTGELFAWTLLIVLLSAGCACLFGLALRLIRRRLEGGRAA